MVTRPPKDELVTSGATRSPAGLGIGSALPTQEPQGRSLVEQRADLQRTIYELDGTLRYMGSAHPQRLACEAKLQQLKLMLQQVEAALKLTGR